MELINVMINKLVSWIDNLFSLFGFYSERYSGLLVWGFVAIMFAKIFKIKFSYSK